MYETVQDVAHKLFKEHREFWLKRRESRGILSEFKDDLDVINNDHKFIEYFETKELQGIGKINLLEAFLIREICKELQPKFILEIGIFTGVSTLILAKIAEQYDGKFVAFDGKLARGVQKNVDIVGLQDRTTLIEAWTPWIGESIDNWEIDLLHIDGDHSRIGVIADFHFFNRFLKKDGVVLFHDNDLLAVRNAVEILQESFQLEDLGKASRMRAFKKLDERDEVYLQVNHGREKMLRGF